ncbi:unnamed protein product [Closterium sp. NIES-53]
MVSPMAMDCSRAISLLEAHPCRSSHSTFSAVSCATSLPTFMAPTSTGMAAVAHSLKRRREKVASSPSMACSTSSFTLAVFHSSRSITPVMDDTSSGVAYSCTVWLFSINRTRLAACDVTSADPPVSSSTSTPNPPASATARLLAREDATRFCSPHSATITRSSLARSAMSATSARHAPVRSTVLSATLVSWNRSPRASAASSLALGSAELGSSRYDASGAMERSAVCDSLTRALLKMASSRRAAASSTWWQRSSSSSASTTPMRAISSPLAGSSRSRASSADSATTCTGSVLAMSRRTSTGTGTCAAHLSCARSTLASTVAAICHMGCGAVATRRDSSSIPPASTMAPGQHADTSSSALRASVRSDSSSLPSSLTSGAAAAAVMPSLWKASSVSTCASSPAASCATTSDGDSSSGTSGSMASLGGRSSASSRPGFSSTFTSACSALVCADGDSSAWRSMAKTEAVRRGTARQG